jgi:NAD(P)-dependent dehydrogenase (short-subunit alcohol dehydrogenase family)
MTETFSPALLAGKVAFVAGASSGINLQIAKRYAEAGAKVMVISRSEEKIAAAAASIGGEAIGMACDVRDYGKVAEAFAHCRDKFGEIDIVLSGAAGNFLAPALGMSANAFKTVIDIDLLGTFNVLHASFQHLRKPGASLVSITAGQAVRPMMYQIHACAAKAGVNQVTKCRGEQGPYSFTRLGHKRRYRRRLSMARQRCLALRDRRDYQRRWWQRTGRCRWRCA